MVAASQLGFKGNILVEHFVEDVDHDVCHENGEGMANREDAGLTNTHDWSGDASTNQGIKG